MWNIVLTCSKLYPNTVEFIICFVYNTLETVLFIYIYMHAAYIQLNSFHDKKKTAIKTKAHLKAENCVPNTCIEILIEKKPSGMTTWTFSGIHRASER